MTDGKDKDTKRAHSPMGAVAMLWAWLGFKLRLEEHTVGILMGQVIELLEACNKRAHILGWVELERELEEPEDDEMN